MASQDQAPTSMIDPDSKPVPGAASVMENELPTYRAIEPFAVFSLILGVLSVFSFASSLFYVAAVSAVIFGVLADRRIKRLSGELTGKGLAQAGIALGLVFGLISFTSSRLHDYILRSNAEAFAKKYMKDVLVRGRIADAVWYALPEDMRRQYTPNGAYEKLRAAGSETFEQQMGGMVRLKERLESVPGQMKLEYVGLEYAGQTGENIKAAALLRVTGPPTARFPTAEEYALAEIDAKRSLDGKFLWQTSSILYPYTPRSKKYNLPPPIDDGHGHGHGH